MREILVCYDGSQAGRGTMVVEAINNMTGNLLVGALGAIASGETVSSQ